MFHDQTSSYLNGKHDGVAAAITVLDIKRDAINRERWWVRLLVWLADWASGGLLYRDLRVDLIVTRDDFGQAAAVCDRRRAAPGDVPVSPRDGPTRGG